MAKHACGERRRPREVNDSTCIFGLAQGATALKLPGVSKTPWYGRESPGVAVGIVTILVPAVVAVWAAATDSKTPGMVVGALFVVALASCLQLLLAFYRAQFGDRKQADKESPLDLTACLLVLHSVLLGLKGLSAEDPKTTLGLLRITILRLDDEYLEQCVPYVGGLGGEAGRRFSVRSGITGRAAMKGDAMVAVRKSADDSAYRKELVEDWSIPPKEARQRSGDRFSWMAVPLHKEPEGVIGVVYLDSTEADFFDQDCQTVVLWWCMGLLSYVDVREGHA